MSAGILLRDVDEADLPILYEHQLDPEAVHMAAFPARDNEAFRKHWSKILSDSTVIVKTIVSGGEVAGNIGSWDQDGRRLLGYWIGRSFWGRGVATAALAAFVEVDRRRPLHAYVAKRNAGSIRVLEKCGFEAIAEINDGLPDENGQPVEEFLFELRTPSMSFGPAAGP